MKTRDKKNGRFLPQGLTSICLTCNTKFKNKECLIGKAKYCNKSCYYISQKGKRQSPEAIKKRVLANTGKKRTMEFRLAQSRNMKGAKNHRYINGCTSERIKLISTIEYKLWRAAVFERDNYTCQKCDARGVKIEADHIVEWWRSKSLRFDVNNGQTLCKPCHMIKTIEERKKYWINQYTKSELK